MNYWLRLELSNLELVALGLRNTEEVGSRSKALKMSAQNVTIATFALRYLALALSNFDDDIE